MVKKTFVPMPPHKRRLIIFLNQTYVVGTQKICFNVMVLLSTPKTNICLNLWIKKNEMVHLSTHNLCLNLWIIQMHLAYIANAKKLCYMKQLRHSFESVRKGQAS